MNDYITITVTTRRLWFIKRSRQVRVPVPAVRNAREWDYQNSEAWGR